MNNHIITRLEGWTCDADWFPLKVGTESSHRQPDILDLRPGADMSTCREPRPEHRLSAVFEEYWGRTECEICQLEYS